MELTSGAGDRPNRSTALTDYVFPKPIPIGVSNRHVHVSREDLAVLFGPDARLTKLRDISQRGQFACHETITLATAAGVIPDVRILGPERAKTQVELAPTDARRLKLRPPVRESGVLEGSCGCTLIGPHGSVQLREGVIIQMRHIHMSPADADHYGVGDRDRVRVWVPGERGMIFSEVLVRVHETFVLDFHLDTDEANGALVKTGDPAYLIDERRLGLDLTARLALPAGGRRLLTERELRSLARKGARYRIPQNVLLTPSARDLARRLKML